MFLLLHGKDEYSAREELARLRETGGFDFNQDTFSGDEADFDQIRTTCDTLPFLTERRLVVVLGLPKPKRGGSGDEDDEDGDEDKPAEQPAKPAGKGKKGKGAGPSPRAFIQALADYAPRTPETTTLVVVIGDELKPPSPLLKAAQEHGRVRLFNQPKGAQLEQWIIRRAKDGGASISPEAARLMVEMVGEELRLLASEIEKLCIYVGRDGQIGVEQVRGLTSQVSPLSVFDLTDALVRRDQRRALTLLHELLASGLAPLAVVGLTAAQTRALIQVKALSERGMRSFQIAETAGLAPFQVEKLLRLAPRFTLAQLEAAHRALLDVDISLKSTPLSPDLALDLLILSFGATDADQRHERAPQ